MSICEKIEETKIGDLTRTHYPKPIPSLESITGEESKKSPYEMGKDKTKKEWIYGISKIEDTEKKDSPYKIEFPKETCSWPTYAPPEPTELISRVYK